MSASNLFATTSTLSSLVVSTGNLLVPVGVVSASNLFATTSTLSSLIVSSGNLLVPVGVVSASNLFATTSTFGSIRLTSTRGILLNSDGTDTNRIMSLLHPTQDVGTDVFLAFGRSNTDRNQGEIKFRYAGDGNDGNFVGIGLHGSSNLLVGPTSVTVGANLKTGDVTVGSLRAIGTTNYTLSYGWLNSLGTVGSTGVSTNPYSIYSEARIAATEINAYSDIRIKEDIQDIVDISALLTLRQIEPKRYNYIDKLTRGNKPVWGFIAQQVGSVLDYSTSTITDFIPNIYDIADIDHNSDGQNYINLRNKTTIGLTSTSASQSPTKIKIYTNENNANEFTTVTLNEVINDTSFTINENLIVSEVFVYGIEVSDFHTLNKDAIFTMNVAATQELDRELEQAKQRIETLEQELQDLKNRLNNAGIP